MDDSPEQANRISEEVRLATRHFFSYQLNSLLIGMGLTCVILSYLVRPYHLEQRAEARLRTLPRGLLKHLPVVISYCEPSGKGGDYKILRAVRLSDSSVRDPDLTTLLDIRGIGMLYLSNTDVSDKGMQILGELSELRHLWLDRTRITDAGIVGLHQLTRVQSLSLNGTSIGDQGVKELCRLPRLKRVELCETNVTANGRMALLAAIPDCVIIH